MWIDAANCLFVFCPVNFYIGKGSSEYEILFYVFLRGGGGGGGWEKRYYTIHKPQEAVELK
jgi:hypothetical protein